MTDIIQEAAALDDLARQGVDIMEMALDIGNRARAHGDVQRYALGQLVLTLTTRYGDGTIKRWCEAVKLGVSSARHYRRVVETYGLTRCIEYAAKDISYTFMMTAAYRFKDPNDAVTFMDAFVNTPIGQEPPELPASDTTRPITLLDVENARICAVNVGAGTITLMVGDGALDVENLPKDVRLHIVLKEMK